MEPIDFIQDRVFDAECAKRAGLVDLQVEIISRIYATYPKYSGYIKQCEELYARVGDFLTTPRGQWLKEHKDKLRLRYK